MDKEEKKPGRIHIITGLSGAGKSTALRAFEDLHYFTVDGLPASLAAEMAAISLKPSMGHFQGMAIGMDLRQDNFPSEFAESMRVMRENGISANIIFLEASDEDLIRRYGATRRPHPLERKGLGLKEAITRERESLASLRARADLVLDSSGNTIHDLSRRIRKLIRKRAEHAHSLRVNLISFGYKYGVPSDADFVFDLRFLPNPYFVAELKPLSGMDQEVSDFIFNFSQAREYRARLWDLLAFILPQMEDEGRARATLAFGCTGGRHRSVAMVEEIARALRQADYPVQAEHRHYLRECGSQPKNEPEVSGYESPAK